ncbi:putative mitochondrial protein [Sesamum alatum]|nr:putative mitochondrial protein [Sesamum alatum]KAK4412333.1 putative mitochondrial protein [Sesamum alatum]
MWYVGSKDSGVPLPQLSLHMKLTRSGLPVVIPPMYRKLLRQKDPRVVRMVLTITAFYRLMKVGKRCWRRVAHETIHHPLFEPSYTTQTWCKKLLSSGASMLKAYAPRYHEIPLELGFSWEPVFTSGPNTYKDPVKESALGAGPWFQFWKGHCRRRFGKAGEKKCFGMTIFHTLPIDATALMTLQKPELLHDVASLLYHPRVHLPTDGYDNPLCPLKEGLDGFNWLMDLLIPPAQQLWWDYMSTRPEAGRFGLKLEGAGKVRTFAIPNPIFQRLLKPLHDWEMSVLKSLRTDGTFDQLRPLRRLRGKKELYSFDLKAATDMFPSVLTGSMLAGIFGDDLGHVWFHMMNQIAFRSPERTGSPSKARVYRFTRGQPLGYLSSWPSFTLTHHMVVWLAAYEVYPGKKFWDYAILGDDIVIADRKVAEAYMRIMDEMGGIISLPKSLISHTGCSYSSLAVHTLKTLGCKFSASFRLKGAGYRTLSRLGSKQGLLVFERLSRRWKRHWLSLYGPSGLVPLPLEVWLAYPEKGIINCYERGRVRQFLLEAVKPRDIDEESLSLLGFFWQGHEETKERFLVSFVASHLRYLKWYYLAILDFELPLEYLLRPPVSPRRIERLSDEKLIERYGLIFRAWDLLRTGEVILPLPLKDSYQGTDDMTVSGSKKK